MTLKMIYERDVAIPVRDGTVLRANVYRPAGDAPCPVIMTMGPYGKDRHLADRTPELARKLGGGPFVNWETPDPETWVPQGYVVIRVDSRGSGQSPGFLAPFTAQIAQDYFDAIEWAGVQPWSTSKVGLLGVSYYGATQWAVAALKPPHLAAIIPWEAFCDPYRELYRHGGILSNKFIEWWYPNTLLNVQHGRGQLPEAELAANRLDVMQALREHPLEDAFYSAWLPDPAAIEVPFLSVGNLGNIGLHLRGNVHVFERASSRHKWLRLVTGDHLVPAYEPEAVAMQRKFLDHFLKGLDNGWQDEPRVKVTLRASDGLSERSCMHWPLEGTQWQSLHLDAGAGSLQAAPPSASATLGYPAEGGTATFTSAAFERRTTVAGPLALRVWASSSLQDMDVFVRLRKVDAQGNDLVGVSPAGYHIALALGWLRASQRKLDAARSRPFQPVHAHDESQPLLPGEPVALDIEIWPTSIVFEPGSRLVLELRGQDFERSPALPGHAAPAADAKPAPYIHFLHDDPVDRPASRFGGTHTLHTGAGRESFLLLPVLPS